MTWGVRDFVDEHLNGPKLWSALVHGTGRISGQLPTWCAYVALLQLMLVAWTIAFAGPVGLAVAALLFSLAHRAVEL